MPAQAGVAGAAASAAVGLAAVGGRGRWRYGPAVAFLHTRCRAAGRLVPLSHTVPARRQGPRLALPLLSPRGSGSRGAIGSGVSRWRWRPELAAGISADVVPRENNEWDPGKVSQFLLLFPNHFHGPISFSFRNGWGITSPWAAGRAGSDRFVAACASSRGRRSGCRQRGSPGCAGPANGTHPRRFDRPPGRSRGGRG